MIIILSKNELSIPKGAGNCACTHIASSTKIRNATRCCSFCYPETAWDLSDGSYIFQRSDKVIYNETPIYCENFTITENMLL